MGIFWRAARQQLGVPTPGSAISAQRCRTMGPAFVQGHAASCVTAELDSAEYAVASARKPTPFSGKYSAPLESVFIQHRTA